MAFFVSICILLRVVVSCWVDDVLLSPLYLVTIEGGSRATDGVSTEGAESASKHDIGFNQDRLDNTRKKLEIKEDEREEVNQRHSQAGDDDNSELEERLGRELESRDNEISSLKEFIKDLVEWFAN